MDRALELARRGLGEGELPIGSVVAAAGEILAEAYWREGRRLEHPELVALLEADRAGHRSGLALFTTLEPCLMCMGAAMSSFVERVVYGLGSRSDGAALVAASWAPVDGHPEPDAPAAYHVPEVLAGVGAAESRALIEAYLARQPSGAVARWAGSLLDGGK